MKTLFPEHETREFLRIVFALKRTRRDEKKLDGFIERLSNRWYAKAPVRQTSLPPRLVAAFDGIEKKLDDLLVAISR